MDYQKIHKNAMNRVSQIKDVIIIVINQISKAHVKLQKKKTLKCAKH